MVIAIKQRPKDAAGDGPARAPVSLPGVDFLMALVSPDDGEPLCISEADGTRMRLVVEELNAASLASGRARQAALQQSMSNFPPEGIEVEPLQQAASDEEHAPPNGTLATQLTQRRFSLRKAPPLPPPPPLFLDKQPFPSVASNFPEE
jgi:hypothetical protein